MCFLVHLMLQANENLKLKSPKPMAELVKKIIKKKKKKCHRTFYVEQPIISLKLHQDV